MSARVMITGIGVVSPLGCGVRQTLQAIDSGRLAAAPVSVFDAGGFPQPSGAEVRDFNAREYFRQPKALKLTARPAQFAVAAATMALRDAQWPHPGPSDRLGVAVGCSGSDMQVPDLGRALAGASFDEVERIPVFADRVLKQLNPLWLLMTLPNMSSAHVAIQLEARGPNTTIMSDWPAGLQAIGEAAEWIRTGETDAVLAGGADTGLAPFAYAAFTQAGLFAGATPFVPGEGAAICMLENHDVAALRDVPAIGEVVAYWCGAASVEDTVALADTVAAMLRRVSDQAGWDLSDVAVLLLTLGGARLAEVGPRVLAQTFGGRTIPTRCTSFEPFLGHALAAAAPIDLALVLGSQRDTAPRGGILCASVGLSGQIAALAVRPGNG
jgi:3-oxoacyl-[acyl-carrier-protein] synthase II